MKGIIIILLLLNSCDKGNVKKETVIKKNKVEIKNNSNNKIIEKSTDIIWHYSINEKYPLLYLYHNGKLIKVFILPIGTEVKNIEYKKLKETKKGFNIYFEWGGFNYSHQNTFIFENDKKGIRLTKIKTKIYNNIDENITIDSVFVNPPLLINKVSIKDIYSKYKKL